MKTILSLYILLFSSQLIFSQSKFDTAADSSWRAFADSSWRALEREGNYQGAIQVIQQSMIKTEMAFKHQDCWHIAQMYAFDNDYTNALIYFKKSYNVSTDREFNWYYRGTIAFIKKDKKKLESCYKKAWKKKSGYYAVNACRLKGMYENFDKSYKEAYSAPCE